MASDLLSIGASGARAARGALEVARGVEVTPLLEEQPRKTIRQVGVLAAVLQRALVARDRILILAELEVHISHQPPHPGVAHVDLAQTAEQRLGCAPVALDHQVAHLRELERHIALVDIRRAAQDASGLLRQPAVGQQRGVEDRGVAVALPSRAVRPRG